MLEAKLQEVPGVHVKKGQGKYVRVVLTDTGKRITSLWVSNCAFFGLER